MQGELGLLHLDSFGCAVWLLLAGAVLDSVHVSVSNVCVNFEHTLALANAAVCSKLPSALDQPQSQAPEPNPS